MVDIAVLPTLASLDTETTPIIYHYCSLETFLSIIENHTIRLSDINTLNDFSELHWAYARFIEAANKEGKNYTKDFLDSIDAVVSSMQLNTLPLVGCFSKEGDVLSQWRAYADNGAGVSIGFDAAIIQDLSVRCAPVEYNTNEQVEYFTKLIDGLIPAWQNKIQDDDWITDNFRLRLFDMCLMKNPAFSEEKEVRIVRAVVVGENDGNLIITDHGGVGRDKLAKKRHKIKFRVRNGGLIAHIDLSLGVNYREAIKEVVLGPRSGSGPNEIGMALSANGFRGFKILSSLATYR